MIVTKQEEYIRRFLDASPRRPMRMVVDTTAAGVDVPESIRKSWGTRLVLDVLPNYPIEPEYSVKGIELTFASRGLVWRGVFTWRSIWAVAPLDVTDPGEALVVEDCVPHDVRVVQLPQTAENLRDDSAQTSTPAQPKWTPRVIKGGKS